MIRLVGGVALALALVLGTAAGNRAFQEGRFEDAAAEFRRAIEAGDESPLAHYNLGTALVRLGRYEEARPHLDRAASGDAPPRVRQAAQFNAGNADLEPAFRAEPSAERSDALRRAIVRYRQALLLDPADVDAKWNLELAQRLLAQQAGGGGGGGGADDPQQGDGGGGPEDGAPAQQDPAPEPGAGGGEAGMRQAEAERVLRTAAQRDRELQQQKLRRNEPAPPNVRDW